MIVDAEQLRRWCGRHLKAEPESELFRSAHLSYVVGVRLTDGREVVVKERPFAERLRACFVVQRRLFAAGMPVPEPLVAPTKIDGSAVTAERHLPGGTMLPASGRAAAVSANALASIVGACPRADDVGSLEPLPAWTAWNHPGSELWPQPDDCDLDLNAAGGPVWLDQVAAAARRRLARCQADPVVGHGDWFGGNLRWQENELHAVYDWDSCIAAPESVIAGLAAAVFPATGEPGQEASIEESAAFLDAYMLARGRVFGPDDVEEAWAASLWTRAFDAKKQFAANRVALGLGEPEARQRLRLAHAE